MYRVVDSDRPLESARLLRAMYQPRRAAPPLAARVGAVRLDLIYRRTISVIRTSLLPRSTQYENTYPSRRRFSICSASRVDVLVISNLRGLTGDAISQIKHHPLTSLRQTHHERDCLPGEMTLVKPQLSHDRAASEDQLRSSSCLSPSRSDVAQSPFSKRSARAPNELSTPIDPDAPFQSVSQHAA